VILIPTDISQVLLLDRINDAENLFYDRSVSTNEAGKNVANAVFAIQYEVEGAFDEAYLLKSGRK
jgi:hypothetical protein